MLSFDPDWHADAACRGMDQSLFFPERGTAVVRQATLAKVVCAGCPVREPCLEWAVDMGERFGIWGGTTEKERRRLRRLRLVS